MVASGLGITLIPELAVEREAAAVPGLHVLPFGADGPPRSVGLAWRSSSPRVDEYRAFGETLATAYARSELPRRRGREPPAQSGGIESAVPSGGS